MERLVIQHSSEMGTVSSDAHVKVIRLHGVQDKQLRQIHLHPRGNRNQAPVLDEPDRRHLHTERLIGVRAIRTVDRAEGLGRIAVTVTSTQICSLYDRTRRLENGDATRPDYGQRCLGRRLVHGLSVYCQ